MFDVWTSLVDPLTSLDTPFRIGSISKLFTTIMMLQLKEAGTIDINAPITEYYPAFSVQNPFSGEGIGPTNNLLSTHMSGLPRGEIDSLSCRFSRFLLTCPEVPCTFMYAYGCPEPASVILSRVANLSLVLPPGLHPSYSNLGFALLGRGLEGVGGGSWESRVVSRVIEPLHMNNTGHNLTSMVCNQLQCIYAV
jgi:D-alanyl-D-alanine carboxypeptidase